MASSFHVLVVFVITALFDVALNVLPPPVGAVLTRRYFDQHTLLSAALIAGFTGAVTVLPISALVGSVANPSLWACVVVFVVSALIGFPMQWSGLFPHLNKHYYGVMPRYQSFLADGVSGVMVATVFWFVMHPRTFPYLAAGAGWAACALLYYVLLRRGVFLYSIDGTGR